VAAHCVPRDPQNAQLSDNVVTNSLFRMFGQGHLGCRPMMAFCHAC
jgi:hypothetical protein